MIGFDKGPVSRTLSVLQKRGLVTIRTAPDDGRTHSISLTAKGRATHDRVIVAALERERRLLSCLRKDEREVLIDLLRRVHGNLDAVKGVGRPLDLSFVDPNLARISCFGNKIVSRRAFAQLDQRFCRGNRALQPAQPIHSVDAASSSVATAPHAASAPRAG